ncbi:MAG TPA: alpha/beta hydrolase family protein [Pirellulaceae bacterium]|nr:alpha/beta hydrolase family protein [Pirellulaceae bacterium]
MSFRFMAMRFCCATVPLLMAAIVVGQLDAAHPRVLPAGKAPADRRLEPLKDLNGYFPFTPSKSPGDWSKRAEQVRRQLLVSLGLWPMPKTTPLNPVIHGKIERDGYTVEKVYFESLPGFYCTGSLYRPTGKSGKSEKLPGVLCPHGHWNNGRFLDSGREATLREIVSGGERFEEGGRSVLQARCMQLARMGCVVFHYDMIGYADSTQLSFDLAHRFAAQRPDMNGADGWGLFSPRAEAHLQSIMGLQTYNSIRSLDFLASLPDVDASRIGVTGASGGGTQTFILGALDPRPAVAYPAVMVSTAMQGGCTCENCSLLRIDTGNVEFAAMFAPKPLGLSAANDWTREMPTKGFPELKKHYEMLGAGDKVMLKSTLHFDHNYNYPNRAAMYSWFNKHLKLGLPEPIVEGDYKRLTTAELSVWDDAHPKPPSGPAFEKKLTKYLADDAQSQLAALTPTDGPSLKKYQDVVGGAVDVLVGRGLPAAGQVEYEQVHKSAKTGYLDMGGVLRNKAVREELPIEFLHPTDWKGRVAIVLSKEGKSGLFNDQDEPRAEVKRLLDAGISVVGVDLLHQGEFLADGKPLTKTPQVANNRQFAGYTNGYNPSVAAERVRDVLTVVSFVRNFEAKPSRVDLVALDGLGPVAAVARAQARDAIDAAVIDTAGFRFANVPDIQDPNFLPGGGKYGDVPGILSVAAPAKLVVVGEGAELPKIVQAAYKAAGAEKNAASAKDAASALGWLLAN